MRQHLQVLQSFLFIVIYDIVPGVSGPLCRRKGSVLPHKRHFSAILSVPALFLFVPSFRNRYFFLSNPPLSRHPPSGDREGRCLLHLILRVRSASDGFSDCGRPPSSSRSFWVNNSRVSKNKSSGIPLVRFA